MSLAKLWGKPRRGQNPKWPSAAFLEIPKSDILGRFYSKIAIKVSILYGDKFIHRITLSNFDHLYPEIQDGRHFTYNNILR